MNLLKNIKIAEVLAPIVAGSSIDSDTDRVDMSGYDGVLFIAVITDSAATGVAALALSQNTIDSDTGMAALENSTATVTCAVNDDVNDTLLIVDLYRPEERYIKGILTSATANIAYGNTLAIRYKGKKRPETDHASISQAILSVSPDEA